MYKFDYSRLQKWSDLFQRSSFERIDGYNLLRINFTEYCATEILNEHFPNDPRLLFVVVETDELWTLWNYEEYNVSIIFDHVSNRFQ